MSAIRALWCSAVDQSIKRVTRLVAAFVAVLALMETTAVLPAWACETTHESAAAMKTPVEHTANHSDCDESSSSTPSRHTTDCLLNCVSMAGCGSPGLMSPLAFTARAARESVTPLSPLDAYSSLSLEPDRPPPRS